MFVKPVDTSCSKTLFKIPEQLPATNFLDKIFFSPPFADVVAWLGLLAPVDDGRLDGSKAGRGRN